MYFLLVIVNITISGTLVKKIYFFIHYNATFIKIVIDSLIFIINYFLQKYANVEVKADATINTESPAWAIDRLSILAVKIYHMQQEVERKDASPEHVAKCREKLRILLEQRADLSMAITQLLDEIESGKKYMKVYKQMKMYNDPALNPVLYKK